MDLTIDLKQTLIFGDSYSTFENYIPQGYAAYYTEIPITDTDVTKVTETWWHMLLSEAGGNLLLNNSWSGSTIGYTGYENADCSGTSSFIFRFRQLKESGFFKGNKVDTVLIFGGTNDSWCNAPVGSLQYSDWKKEDLYCVLPAVSCFFHELKEELPDANLICLINTELKPEIEEGLKAAGSHYGIHSISLQNIDKISGHPTIEGMKNFKDQVLAYLQ